jgi:hydrogenase expression/formation protein HypC
MCLGIPGLIVRIDDAAKKVATAEVAGVQRQVNYACIPDIRIGEWVLMHVGFAMARIDETQAAETLQILKELGEAA